MMIVIIFNNAINCFLEPGQFLGPDVLEGYFIRWTEVNDLLQLIDVNSSRDLPKFRSIPFLMSLSAPTFNNWHSFCLYSPIIIIIIIIIIITITKLSNLIGYQLP